MTTLALEIHDTGIRAVDETGETRVESPGYALYEGGKVVTGQAAMNRARKKPRFTHNRFWQDLDTEPLGRPFPRGLSAADLAHAQLSEIWDTAKEDTDSVLLSIPSCFEPRRLGLILGIARSCGMPVDGMVDAAVAATASAPFAAETPERKILHLDLHLHRIVLTELEVNVSPAATGTPSARVVHRRRQVDESLGMVALQDAWARRLAEFFVHSTRFDPLHSATAEQALYRRLPEWLEELRYEEIIKVELGPAGQERSIELTRPDVVEAVDSFYEHLRSLVLSLKRAGEAVTLLLAQPAAELIGLEPRLAELRDVTTVRLPPGSAAAGTLRNRREICSAGDHNVERTTQDRASENQGTQALPFVTRLRFELSATTATFGEAAPDPLADSSTALAAPVPSHLLYDGTAYPITDEPLVLGLAIGDRRGVELTGQTAGISRAHCSVSRSGGRVWVEDQSTYGSFVNDERVAGRARLAIGDRLRLGTPGIEVQLIKVVGTDGTP